jgi:hypothetical protein
MVDQDRSLVCGYTPDGMSLGCSFDDLKISLLTALLASPGDMALPM